MRDNVPEPLNGSGIFLPKNEPAKIGFYGQLG